MLLLGSHVSMNGKDMLLGSAKEAHMYAATTMMIYTGAPQNTRRKPIEELNIDKGKAALEQFGISNIVVHAPYIINLGNTIKNDHFEFAVEFLREEIKRATALGATQITMHPGAHVGAGSQVAIRRLIEGLNLALDSDQVPQIALETMAGKGTEIGRSFEELADIIAGVTHNHKLSVTLDTCHTHDAGYNIKDDFDGVLNEFDKVIGLDKLKVIHVNDSKNVRGAKKDRHANIGFGEIGFDALHYVVHHPQLVALPKILETPYVQVGEDKKNTRPPYKHEIAMLRSGQFNPHLLEEIVQ
ncbi:deoxyribonuclease IV [Carnobacteriaceae bacterium zg-ZUI78]|uniref:deoxyribonuclease IV n=1 Tax=Granulicatella sp. zg-84 TaxID=2678503 RepID=UPI0013C13320|nr:deoxyribonuclease IV [Granulicatella sp. zg-84]MBS4750061.1 deoxyribonuclease IV [Carnobacteriaceae bacterium zg-ZUI78]NEW65783.1 deoxyribonuclease IV [Granulicatella sp. zg-84]QMI86290.1 deoxyribonuclease IV [Carnobacteriaceae bacterium zg-84]